MADCFLLLPEGIVRVPVTEDGKLLGIVSRADVIKAAPILNIVQR